jgi:hypothetical protein
VEEIHQPRRWGKAVNRHDDVLACVAFSTGHSLLRSCGIGFGALTCLHRTVGLPSLHEYTSDKKLAARSGRSLIYMDDVAKRTGVALSGPAPFSTNDISMRIERTFKPSVLLLPCVAVIPL